MAEKVTLQDVERVAELAHLELSPDESSSMVRDLNSILEYVAQLSELNTESVVPLAQVTELESSVAANLREDAIRPSLNRTAVMAEAPETDQAFFKVPKVIER